MLSERFILKSRRVWDLLEREARDCQLGSCPKAREILWHPGENGNGDEASLSMAQHLMFSLACDLLALVCEWEEKHLTQEYIRIQPTELKLELPYSTSPLVVIASPDTFRCDKPLQDVVRTWWHSSSREVEPLDAFCAERQVVAGLPSPALVQAVLNVCITRVWAEENRLHVEREASRVRLERKKKGDTLARVRAIHQESRLRAAQHLVQLQGHSPIYSWCFPHDGPRSIDMNWTMVYHKLKGLVVEAVRIELH